MVFYKLDSLKPETKQYLEFWNFHYNVQNSFKNSNFQTNAPIKFEMQRVKITVRQLRECTWADMARNSTETNKQRQ